MFFCRYFSLVDKAIDPFMISPVEESTLKGIFRFVPKSLRTCIPQATADFIWVSCVNLYCNFSQSSDILKICSYHFKICGMWFYRVIPAKGVDRKTKNGDPYQTDYS